MSAEGLETVHGRFKKMMEVEGATIDGIYACVHAPGDGCECRKPRPGLLLLAAKELDLNLSASFLVGDDNRDLVAADAAGVSPVLVRTGKGGGDSELGVKPDFVAENVEAAVDWILEIASQTPGDDT